ncbi:cystathionine gamma-lyase [Acrasis kona]|uniref:cystathionine gamma-lyase n=1 Tax=Acrasis kona TaxID=1008807 RepID=A0AAW2ZJ00_9EUKA
MSHTDNKLHTTTTFPHFGTDAIHAGQTPDPHSGAVMIPISLSTTFAQTSPGVPYPGNFEYARSANPTRDAFEKNIAALEGAKFGLSFSSGLGATSIIINSLKRGDHVISVDDVYGGTGRLFRTIASDYGIEFTYIDFNVEGALEKAIQPNTKLVWLETPTNPTLRLSDVSQVAEVAHKHNAILVVDNTFMSPYFQRPLSLGADVVMHSVTKYINGHSDTVMGVIATNNETWYGKFKYLQNAMGITPSPFDCFLALRGIKTLHVRMQRHEQNATALARWMEGHEKISKIAYPGLESHPQHDLAKKQMRGFGGMITFWIKGGITQSRQFLENLKVFTLAESLGGVESLVNHPAIMTHASVPADVRAKLGIDDTLIRLSVGIENSEDIIEDVKQALEKVNVYEEASPVVEKVAEH